MNKKQAIAAVKAADITVDDWTVAITEKLADRYAAGYLEAKIGHLLDSTYSGYEEDFRSDFLDMLGWSIWEKGNP